MKKVYKYINIVLLAVLSATLFVSCGPTKTKYGCPEKMDVSVK